MKKYDDIAFFEALFLGNISPIDEQRFKEAMDSDPELQKNYRAIKHILSGMHGLRNQSFLSEVEGWEAELQTEGDAESEMLEAYAREQLSTEEAAYVSAKIEKDVHLKTHFESLQGVMRGFKGIRESEMSEKVKGWEQEIQEGEKKNLHATAKRFNLGRNWAIAASILALIVAGQFILNQTFGNQQILREVYAPPLTTTMRGGEEGITDLEAALALLKTNRLEESLQKVEYALSLDAQNNQALLLKAHILFTQNEDLKASNVLSHISTESTSVSMEKNWLETLLKVRAEGASSELHESLEKIINDENHPYQKPAIQLQKRLQSWWRKMLIFK